MTAQTVPVRSALSDLYPSDALLGQGKRWKALAEKFEDIYGTKPKFVARCPGRVNIIGEHVDYSLYDCLPMGIAADVVIAVGTEDQTGDEIEIKLHNVHDKFPASSFRQKTTAKVEVDVERHSWTNYFKAGFSGAVQHLREKEPQIKLKSLNLLFDGTVPPGGGLSSSAAFVCASALATCYGNGMNPSLHDLTSLAIVSERLVGVNSGGLDQSASVFSQHSSALHVAFVPELSTTAIPFPATEPPMTFMIAQSLVVSNKQATAPKCYNLRVMECTLAANVLASRCGVNLEHDSSPLGTSLRGFEEAYFKAPKQANLSHLDQVGRLRKLLELVEENLPRDGSSREDIASSLKISQEELHEQFISKIKVDADKFQLFRRAKHVYSEAIRVHEFIATLQGQSSEVQSTSGEFLVKLGNLMNATQQSCRDLYECSCSELDELCTIARNAGSYGSRLTGAGWGGCTVHLVPKNKVEAIRQAWQTEYYNKKHPDLSAQELEDAIVISEPGQGAMLIELDT